MAGKIAQFPGMTPQDVTPRQVVSYEVSNLFGAKVQERYNPDDLATRKGLAVYSRMMNDEQVKAVMTFRSASITARGYEFRYEDDSPLAPDERDLRIAFFQRNVCDLRGSFQDALNGILRGHVFGFSLTEKVYDTVEYEGKSKLGLAALLSREAAWFRFFTDRYGTLDRCEQWIGNEKLAIDLSKFIHYVRAPEVDRYYGQSDLRAAYRAWYIKDVLINLYATYLERFAGGFAYAEIGDTANLSANTTEYNALKTALENIRNLASVMVPPGVVLKFFQPTSTGENREALTYMDLAIAKAVLVPNLLGLSHTGQTGAFSQSQTQLEAYFMTTAADATRLEDVLNEQLFRDLGDLNYDDGQYPRFYFKPASQEHVKWIVDTWKALAGGNTVQTTEADEAHLRKLLEMPARTADDVLMKEENLKLEQQYAPEPAPVPFTLDQLNATLLERDERLLLTFTQAVDKISRPAAVSDGPTRLFIPGRTDAPSGLDPKHGAPRSVGPVTFARAVNRVDFALIERRHELASTDAVEQAARLIARAARRALNDEKLAGLLDQDVADIGELTFDGADVGKIKGALKEALGRAWALGTETARREVGKAQGPAATFATLRDNAAEYFEANGFRMAANLTDGMRAIIQQELLQAVKSGLRPEDVVARIYDRLIRKGFTTQTAVEREETRAGVLPLLETLLEDALDVANVPAYLNTLVRTNTFEALNEARFAAFEDPDLAGFVVAYEYSAILDDRTTQICEALDDGIWRNDSEVWDSYRPPNHYNCRSLLVPVFVTDGWDGAESAAPTVEPQEGFK